VALIGCDLRKARHTVPLAQAGSLRSIDIYQKYFKAGEWMHHILCSEEVLLAGRILRAFDKIFMAVSHACRLLFRPRGVSEADIQSIDNDFKNFVTNYYDNICRGSGERLQLCQSTVSSLLNIDALLRACGPA